MNFLNESKDLFGYQCMACKKKMVTEEPLERRECPHCGSMMYETNIPRKLKKEEITQFLNNVSPLLPKPRINKRRRAV